SRGADAAQHAPTDQPRDVEMMRSLTKDNASAHASVQLCWQARTIQPVIEIPAADHAQRTDLARAHQLANRADRRLVALGLTDDELDPTCLYRGDHCVRVFEGDGQRFLADDVFARRDC